MPPRRQPKNALQYVQLVILAGFELSTEVELERNHWNLNISRYVDTSDDEERGDVADAVRKLRELDRDRAKAEATMNRYLAELGYGS